MKQPYILQINTNFTRGGAARIMCNIHEELLAQRLYSKIVTGAPIQNKKNIFQMPKTGYYAQNFWEKFWFFLSKKIKPKIGIIPGAGRLSNLLYTVGRPDHFRHQTGTWDFFRQLTPFPDIIHIHNLHGDYFDLRILPYLSKRVPVVVTLHDEWMFTGHCACTLGCEKWLDGCRDCPDLHRYERLKFGTPNFTIMQKKEIYKKCRLHLITPSKWLLDRAKRSILAPALLSSKVIHNGTRSGLFKCVKPQNQDRNSYKILYVANQAKTNEFKDYQTLEKAIFWIAQKKILEEKLELICVGEKEAHPPVENIVTDDFVIKFIDYIEDQNEIAKFYQNADIFTYATKADTFPTTVIEALASGLPVIATRVGGIPEQIDEFDKSQNPTGMMYEQGNYKELGEKIIFLLQDKSLREEMSQNAINIAREKFGLQKQVEKYVELYERVLS